MRFVKSGALIMHQLLDALYRGDAARINEMISLLDHWFFALEESGTDMGVFGGFPKAINTVAVQIFEEVPIEAKDALRLRAPLAEAMEAIMGDLEPRVFLEFALGNAALWRLREDVPTHPLDGGNMPATGENSLHIALLPEESAREGMENTIDAFMSLSEIREWVDICYPLDSFDYNHAYLTGKFDALARADATRIAIAGDAHALAAIDEGQMPRKTVQLALGGQDPYYALAALRRAVALQPNIDTLMIAGIWHFWHLDISGADEALALRRVFYPILRDAHNFSGDLRPPHARANCAPLMERIFDLNAIRTHLRDALSEELAKENYYNPRNPRPEFGNLPYDFHEQRPGNNERGAGRRAALHNRDCNASRVAENIAVFRAFLREMRAAGRRVLYVALPATLWYQSQCGTRLRDAVLPHMADLRGEGLGFISLYGDSAFKDAHFLDYDHVNDQGAELATQKIVESGLI